MQCKQAELQCCSHGARLLSVLSLWFMSGWGSWGALGFCICRRACRRRLSECPRTYRRPSSLNGVGGLRWPPRHALKGALLSRNGCIKSVCHAYRNPDSNPALVSLGIMSCDLAPPAAAKSLSSLAARPSLCVELFRGLPGLTSVAACPDCTSAGHHKGQCSQSDEQTARRDTQQHSRQTELQRNIASCPPWGVTHCQAWRSGASA